MCYHRNTFYEVRRAFQVGGVAALDEEKRWPRHPHPFASQARVPPLVPAICVYWLRPFDV